MTMGSILFLLRLSFQTGGIYIVSLNHLGGTAALQCCSVSNNHCFYIRRAFTSMLYPDGESHSKKKMVPAANWMATRATSIQLAVSNGSRKAVGEIMPVRFAT